MKLRILSVVIFIIMVMVFFSMHKKFTTSKDYFDARCHSWINYEDRSLQSVFNFKGELSFKFNKMKRGEYYISGSMQNATGEFYVSRYVRFDYVYQDDGVYVFKPTSVQKTLHDNISEPMVLRLEKALPLTHSITINMKVLNDEIIFSNAVSPLFICVTESNTSSGQR